MGFCTGSPQGSWTLASGPLGPQYLEELASWCGCGWGPSAYPCSPHPGVYRDPQGCPRSATWICESRPGPRRPHPTVRGGARIQGCTGPWGGPNQLSPHRSWCQGSPGPTGLGAVSLCSLCHPPGGRVAEAGHSGFFAPLTYTHSVGDSVPSLLPATPVCSIEHPVF